MWEREVEKAFKSFWVVSLPGRIGEHEGNAKTGNRFRYRAWGAKDIARSFPSPGAELRRRSGGKWGAARSLGQNDRRHTWTV